MSFGQLAKSLLQQLASISREVHLVCDVYSTPSIKDMERERRGNYDIVYHITGPEQMRPKDWQVALRSSSFKTQLFNFLAVEWENVEYLHILWDCHVYLAVNSECFCFTTVDDVIRRSTIQALKSFHEEADTRMVFHLDFVSRVQDVSNIIIRSNDTYVLVIPLYHLANTEKNINVWMEAGLNSNNTRCLNSINNIIQNLTKEVALT